MSKCHRSAIPPSTEELNDLDTACSEVEFSATIHWLNYISTPLCFSLANYQIKSHCLPICSP